MTRGSLGIASVVSAALMLCGCGGSGSGDSSTATNASATTPATTPTTTTATTPTNPTTNSSTSSPPPSSEGVSAVQVSATSLGFGNNLAGTTSPSQDLTISNSGTTTLTISSMALSGTDATSFSLVNGCGATLTVGASCSVAVTFSPATAGAKSAILTLETSAASNPSIALSGTGVIPVASTNAASLAFPSTTVGTTSAPQTVTISNTGTAALTVGSISLGGQNAGMFAETSTCSAPIPPAGSCTVIFTFAPTTSGSLAAVAQIATNAATNPSVALNGTAVQPTPPAAFPPYPAADSRVLLDIGIAALNPRNTWETLPAGFALGQVTGATAGTLSDTLGFTPNSGGYIENSAAFPSLPSAQATIYMRLERSALAADNSADVGVTFYDSTGNTTGGTGSTTAAAFTIYDGTNNIIEWAMSAQPTSGPQILDAGSWLYPGARYGNSHSSPNLDPTYEDIILTWQGSTYWVYFDGTPAGYGTFPTALPTTGLFSQVVIGAYLYGTGSNGHPLGPYTIQRFQLSNTFSPPPVLAGEPLVGFYGDSFVVQGGGVTGDVPGISGSPTAAQVNSVQAQLDQTTSPSATTGTIGQDGFISRAQAYALKQYGGYLQFFTAAQSGHGWAYTGMGGTSAANTPAIDDFALGKTGFSDALNAAQPDYIFAFGSVNDVNNGVPADIAGDTKAHFDYWANHNPNLKGIYYVETLSWELATGACTSRGGPAGWKAEMARQRGLLRAAFGGGYLAGTRQVPVTYIKTYETWVEGPNSARFLIASNPDNQSQSSNTGSNPNGHPDAEGNIQMVDAYVWPYLTPLLH